MFRGAAHINLDAKGRMAFPSRYRERLQALCDGQVVVTLEPDSPDHPLLIYPQPHWEPIEQQIDRLPSLDPYAQRIRHLMLGHATECQLDGNGRILLPELLRGLGRLNKKVVLIGQGRKFELWDEAIWVERRDQWLAEIPTKQELTGGLETLSF